MSRRGELIEGGVEVVEGNLEEKEKEPEVSEGKEEKNVVCDSEVLPAKKVPEKIRDHEVKKECRIR